MRNDLLWKEKPIFGKSEKLSFYRQHSILYCQIYAGDFEGWLNLNGSIFRQREKKFEKLFHVCSKKPVDMKKVLLKVLNHEFFIKTF